MTEVMTKENAMDGTLTGLVGQAPAFRQVVSRIPALGGVSETVLITGETGTGKELIARAIHQCGPRCEREFLAVNCGTLVDPALESELFGHERGAFPEAHDRKDGLLARAAGGTIFLDKLETLAPRAQAALARVLENGRYRRLGAPEETSADVRFVAATDAKLEPLLESGRLRSDVYYRLSVLTLHLPPLRERREDLLPLAEHFLARHAARFPTPPRFSTGAVEAMVAYDWPGNVRELESAVVRAAHAAASPVLEAADLGLPAPDAAGRTPPTASQSYKAQKRRVMEAFERQYLMRLMADHRGNVTHAAVTAGKERRDLGKLLKRHGIDPRQFIPPRV